MNKFSTIAIASLLLASSCSLFSSDEKEKPRIIYTNESMPSVEASLNPADAVTQREPISVPSVTEQITGVTTEAVVTEVVAEQPETIVINKDTVATEPNTAITVTRIRVEDAETTSTEPVQVVEKVEEKVVVETPTETVSVVSEVEVETPVVTNAVADTTDYGNESQPSGEAEVGQCYGKVRIAGTFKDVVENVVIQAERTEKKAIPAKYNYVEEEVVVREETEKYIEIPATYKIVTEQVVVEPEKKKITTIPAKYETVQERVMVKPASKVWKKGRGLIEKTGSDGEIMCLVEEPAKYEMVDKQVLVEPERQEVSIIPAVTKIITKEVIDKPARVEKTLVPAIKNRISKKVLVEPEQMVDVKIPAVYKAVNKKVPLTPSKITWRPVLCDYNITPSVIMKLQESLTLRGYDTGGVDGIFGSRTAVAVNDFQKSLGMESSGITLETLRALGVSY